MADPRTHRPRLWSSAATVGVLLLAVLLVPPLVQLDEQAVDLSRKLLPPSWEHPFGTDDLGRDLLP
ncbi:ABC transporter permease, partial [Streptomyces wedmorensis]